MLLEAAPDPERIGSLYLPPAYEERYPQIGWVVAFGEIEEELEIGDLVVVPGEGERIERTYFQVLRLELKDFGPLMVDAETEPIIWEAYYEHQRTGEEQTIKVVSIENEHYSFLTSDILDLSLVDLSNPLFKLDYVPATFLRIWKDGLERLYYLIREEEILCRILEW